MTPVRALLLLAGLCAGCGDAAKGTLVMSWQFADGRRCVDTGAATVSVSASSELGSFPCPMGAAPASVSVDGVTPGSSLTVRAVSPAGDELYRAGVSTDESLTPITVTLYATGAR
jgi:hypothetical protein